MLEVRPVTFGELAAALRLLYQSYPLNQQAGLITGAIEGIRDGRLAINGMIGGFREEKLVCVGWVTINPGRTASIIPPECLIGEPQSTLTTTIKALLEYVATIDVSVTQAALEIDQTESGELLRSVGFQEAATLQLMMCELAASSESKASTQPSEFQFQPYREEETQLFIDTVDATYEQSLDVPLMDLYRETDDVIAGYRGAAGFRPEWWQLVVSEGQCVGCLILTDYPENENVELVYLGLSPEVRGRGWGRLLTQHALEIAHAAGRKRVVLAVDHTNNPAVAMYESLGFETWDSRRVYFFANE